MNDLKIYKLPAVILLIEYPTFTYEYITSEDLESCITEFSTQLIGKLYVSIFITDTNQTTFNIAINMNTNIILRLSCT